MLENYMALCVSILAGVSPEKAFVLLEGKQGRGQRKGKRKEWSRTEITIMRLLHEKGGTWGDAGRQFGISGSHARSLVMHYSKNN